MPALRELQEEFLDGIFFSDVAVQRRLRGGGNISAAGRMNIYHNSSFLILTDVLKGTFPALVALASEAFFRHLADAFVKAHPPIACDMNSYGGKLPGFMRGMDAVMGRHPYLPDVAQLEWLRQEAYFSADARPVEAEVLSGIAPEAAGQIVFDLHPSFRMFSSVFPVERLWRLGRGEIGVEDVDMNAGGAHVALFRRESGIEMWEVPEAVMLFFAALQQKKTLEESVAAALVADDAFAPEQHLAQLLRAGLVTGICPGGAQK